MTPRGSRDGIALVAAMLTLAALALLALGSTLVVQLDIRLAENRQALALARAEARSNMSSLLLMLEAASQEGELPEVAPASPGTVLYRREGPTAAVLAVEGGAGEGSQRSDARIELREAESGWRVHVVERR